jgi:hypothetical protein
LLSIISATFSLDYIEGCVIDGQLTSFMYLNMSVNVEAYKCIFNCLLAPELAV